MKIALTILVREMQHVEAPPKGHSFEQWVLVVEKGGNPFFHHMNQVIRKNLMVDMGQTKYQPMFGQHA